MTETSQFGVAVRSPEAALGTCWSGLIWSDTPAHDSNYDRRRDARPQTYNASVAALAARFRQVKLATVVPSATGTISTSPNTTN